MQQIHIMSNMVLWCRPSLCKPSPLKKIPVPRLSFYFFRSVGPRPNLIDPITSFGNFRGEDHLQSWLVALLFFHSYFVLHCMRESERQQLSGKHQGATSGGACIFSEKYSLCTGAQQILSRKT